MKILIVDDHTLFREAIQYVLNELADTVSIVEASHYDHALQHAADSPDLDLVLLDLDLPGKNGFLTLDAFSIHYPAMPVVILSGSNHRKDIQQALNAGARGYIQKDTTSVVMLNALRLISSGGIYFPPDMTQFERQTPAINNNKAEHLTPRQREVLYLLGHGYSNKEIAQRLNLAAGTIKMHVTSILKTLKVSNRTQAAMAAKKFELNR